MKCDERTRLLGAYNRATLTLSTAVQHLLNSGEASAAYDLHRYTADKARIEFESARLAYEAHVQEHHCEGGVGGGGTELEAMLDSV
jgi:hypothetical protein